MKATRHGSSRRPAAPRAPFAERLAVLAQREGLQPTAVPGVQPARNSQPSKRCPILYEPMILFIGQGSKRGYFGGEVLHYDANRYLALSAAYSLR